MSGSTEHEAEQAVMALHSAKFLEDAASDCSRYSKEVHLAEALVMSNLAIAEQVKRIADHLEGRGQS